MSDAWFFEESKHRSRRGWVPILAFLLLVINVSLLSYFYIDFNQKSERLNREIETLKFQLSSANYEISALKDAVKSKETGIIIEQTSLANIYNLSKRSVVLIQVRSSFGGGQGSGFVYDNEGRIITNHHVVEGAVEGGITVTFIDGTIVPAEVVGTDPYIDLAVIDVDAAPYLLKPLPLGSSSDLIVGEQVIALGNPFGLSNTMTSGIVSALGREMDAAGGYAIVDVIQTDAAINPGNSGGPLLNLKGEVVGMNTAIISETNQFSGIGFAIPSDAILREAPSIIDNGTYEHPYLGISGYSLNPAVKEHMGLEDSIKGALISDIVKGGPADKAGLRGGNREELVDGLLLKIGGDVVIGVDGKTVTDLLDLIVYLERLQKPGNTIILTIIRDNNITKIEVVLGARPLP